MLATPLPTPKLTRSGWAVEVAGAKVVLVSLSYESSREKRKTKKHANFTLDFRLIFSNVKSMLHEMILLRRQS